MKAARTMVGVVALASAIGAGAAWAEDARPLPARAAMAMMSVPVAAVLPSGRSVQVGMPATAFATMINMGSGMATGCSMTPAGQMSGTFMYQATDPHTNQPVGQMNSPVDVPMGGSQTFVFAFVPTVPMNPTDMALIFSCTNTGPAQIQPGINTLLVSASMTPVPDMVALAATLGNDGIVNVPGANGTGVFAVATVNMGAGGLITAVADTGGVGLPVSLQLCQTDPRTGHCISSSLGSSVTTQVDTGTTPAFGVFVGGHGTVPFDPASNRVYVRFIDGGGVVRGATSVAVRTQ